MPPSTAPPRARLTSGTGPGARSPSPRSGSWRRRVRWPVRRARTARTPSPRASPRRLSPPVRCWPPRPSPRSRLVPEKLEAQVTPGDSQSNRGDLDVLDGPFTTSQLLRIDEALRVADESTGLTFSVYVGELDETIRTSAEKLHSQLADP